MLRLIIAAASISMAFGLLDFSYIVDIEAFGLHVWADLDFGPDGFSVVEWGT